MADSVLDTSRRLAAVRQRPDYAQLESQRPGTAGRHLGFAARTFFVVVFCAVALFIHLTARSMTSRSGRVAREADTFQTALHVFTLVFVIVGLAAIVWVLFRWFRFANARLLAFPALVKDKRTEVSGGGEHTSAQTAYYVTLEAENAERSERGATGTLYGQLAPDDVGVAFVQDQQLLDFRRLRG